MFVHRKLNKQDLYWVNNRNNRIEDLEAIFRVTGKKAEIWHPETGKTEAASYAIVDGHTKVILHLEPNDAVFVVFKDDATETSQVIPAKIETKIATLEGSWDLSFQKDRGAPSQITLEKLNS